MSSIAFTPMLTIFHFYIPLSLLSILLAEAKKAEEEYGVNRPLLSYADLQIETGSFAHIFFLYKLTVFKLIQTLLNLFHHIMYHKLLEFTQNLL